MEEQNSNISVLDNIETNTLIEKNDEDQNNIDNIANIHIGQANEQKEKTEENALTNNTEPEMANCLALALQRDQKSMVAKNTLISIARMAFKTAVSTLGLGILKLIFK